MGNKYEEYIDKYRSELNKANITPQAVSEATYAFLKACNKQVKAENGFTAPGEDKDKDKDNRGPNGSRVGTKIRLDKLSGAKQDEYYSGLTKKMVQIENRTILANHLIYLKALVNFKPIFLKELELYRDNINTLAGSITQKMYVGNLKNVLNSVTKLESSNDILVNSIKQSLLKGIDTSKFTKIIRSKKMTKYFNNIDNIIKNEKSRCQTIQLENKAETYLITPNGDDIWNNIQECKKNLIKIGHIINDKIFSEIDSIISDLHKTANAFYQKNCSDVKTTLKARSKVSLIKCIADAKKEPKYDTIKKVMNELPKNVKNKKKINAILKIIKPLGKIPKKTS